MKNRFRKYNNINEDHGFEDMEVAFGVKHKHENLSDEEKKQFGDMIDAEDQEQGVDLGKPHVNSNLTSVQKKARKEASDYYKETANKMKGYQKPNQVASPSRIGEEFNPPKVNVEDDMKDEDLMYNGHMGTGMSGLRYDDVDTDNYDAFMDRMNKINGNDSTYKKLTKYGDKYKEYKYGEKYEKSENEYQETPRVRTTQKESTLKYSDVISENIFKTKGKIISEKQVLKAASKVPTRVKIDETVFAITDGENYYRLIWEGDRNGEPVITHTKKPDLVSESIEKMKHLWNFDSSKSEDTRSNIKESGDDAFKRIYNKIKGNNLIG